MGEVGVSRGERGGEVEFGLDNVDVDNFVGIVSLCDSSVEEINGISVYDDNVVVRFDGGLFGDVDCDGEGFNYSIFFEGDVVGKFVVEICGCIL